MHYTYFTICLGFSWFYVKQTGLRLEFELDLLCNIYKINYFSLNIFQDGKPIKSNKRIIKNSTDLILTQASKEDFGVYHCYAHNGRDFISKPPYGIVHFSISNENVDIFMIIGIILGLLFISALVIYFIIRMKQIKVCNSCL